MPERPVNEDGNSQSRPGKVWPTGNAGIVAAPSTNAAGKERSAKRHLRAGVSLADSRHDLTTLFARSSVRHADSVADDRTFRRFAN